MNLTGQPYGAKRTNKQTRGTLLSWHHQENFFSLSFLQTCTFFFTGESFLRRLKDNDEKKKGDQKRIKECYTASCGTHTTKWFIFHSFGVCCVPPRDVHMMAVGAVGMFSTGTSVDSLGTTMRWRSSRTVAPPFTSLHFTYPIVYLTVGAPRMIGQPLFSILLCFRPFEGLHPTLILSTLLCCLPISFSVCLSFSLLVQCPVGSSLQVLLILFCAHTISVFVSSQW